MHTIDVPGGTADFLDRDEVTPRRMRPMQVAALQMGSLLTAVSRAASVGGQDSQNLPGPDLPDLSEHQAELFTSLQDLATFAYLQRLVIDGKDATPTSADGLQDLPQGLYNELSSHAAKLSTSDGGFVLNESTVEDHQSPTGASDA